MLAGWINRQQQDVIEYLATENRVLRERHKPIRLRCAFVVCREDSAAGRSPPVRQVREMGPRAEGFCDPCEPIIVYNDMCSYAGPAKPGSVQQYRRGSPHHNLAFLVSRDTVPRAFDGKPGEIDECQAR